MFVEKQNYDISDLLEIMKMLRGKNGCPWDMEQDHKSIRMNVIEEAYEVSEAIDLENSKLLKEELGDLLLQIVFHSEMESEKNVFDFNDVCDGICKKLIYRHPHVFGDTIAENTAEVLKNWDALKSKSKGEETITARLQSVPKTLPALMRAEKVSKRAANAGFELQNPEEMAETLKNEVEALSCAISTKDNPEIDEKIGDVLFACCNLSRFFEKDCEKALTFSINKFIMRFREVERLAINSDTALDKISHDELISLWERAKIIPKN